MTAVQEMIQLGWKLYTGKVANELLLPENEKMMQLHLAQIYQTLSPLFECKSKESYKVLLEVPVIINGSTKRIIDIVIEHSLPDGVTKTAIELKCFRLYARNGQGKRGAQNLGMYDYWEDIENIEGYCTIPGYKTAYQFTLTDDPYYVGTTHTGSQVATYSTCHKRINVTGSLVHPIANRKGNITIGGIYNMGGWTKDGPFYFITQSTAA